MLKSFRQFAKRRGFALNTGGPFHPTDAYIKLSSRVGLGDGFSKWANWPIGSLVLLQGIFAPHIRQLHRKPGPKTR